MSQDCPADVAFFELKIFTWHAGADKAFDGCDARFGLAAAFMKNPKFVFGELSCKFTRAAGGDIVVDFELGKALARTGDCRSRGQ